MLKFEVTAPTRADLAGGTLDLWPLYCIAGRSPTINISIDLPAVVSFEVEASAKFALTLEESTGEKATLENLDTTVEIPALKFPAFVLSSYLKQHPSLPKRTLRVQFKTKAPLRSGLGGSSALCVALTYGLKHAFGETLTQGWEWKILDWAKDTEAAFLRTPTGTQDYLAAIFGGFRSYTSDKGSITESAYSPEAYSELCDRMLLLFSGEMHHSGLTNWEIYKGAVEGKKVILDGLAKLRDIAEQLDEALRAKKRNWTTIGKLLSEEWDVRKATFGVHTERLDEIVAALRESGVLGCRVCGAAGGGSLIALVDPKDRVRIAEAMSGRGIHILKESGVQRGVSLFRKEG